MSASPGPEQVQPTLGGVPGGGVGVGPRHVVPLPPSLPGVLPFGAGMTRPVLIAGYEPVYTKEAIDAGIQGMMIFRCTIKTDGSVTNCFVIKSLPYLEEEVLKAVLSRRYAPATYNGQAIAVDYVFSMNLAPPMPTPTTDR